MTLQDHRRAATDPKRLTTEQEVRWRADLAADRWGSQPRWSSQSVLSLFATLDDERAKTADVLGARDILKDWLDGYDNGYPLANGDWEQDIVRRARSLIVD